MPVGRVSYRWQLYRCCSLHGLDDWNAYQPRLYIAPLLQPPFLLVPARHVMFFGRLCVLFCVCVYSCGSCSVDSGELWDGNVTHRRSTMTARRMKVYFTKGCVEGYGTKLWDVWIPEWKCLSQQKIPDDGGLSMCAVSTVPASMSHQPLVFSFSRQEQYDWELGMLAKIPNAKIHVVCPASAKPVEGGESSPPKILPAELLAAGAQLHQPAWSGENVLTQLIHEKLPEPVAFLNVEIPDGAQSVSEVLLQGCRDKPLFLHLNIRLLIPESDAECLSLRGFFRHMEHCGFMLAVRDRMESGCEDDQCIDYTFIHQSIALAEHSADWRAECGKYPEWPEHLQVHEGRRRRPRQDPRVAPSDP